MKKIICLALITIMTLSLMISVGASAVDYATAENGDLLYEVDFGATGSYKFIDGRSKGWNLTNAQPSSDGKSVTFEYTDTVSEGELVGTGRARYCTNMLSDFDVKGKSYTVQFTIDSKAYVGIALDGNTSFVINPSLNSVMAGQTNYMKGLAGETKYEGTFSSKQTYAIEMVVSAEATETNDGLLAYAPTSYNLYVLDETANNWRLVKEISSDKLNKFEWEVYPDSNEDYAYFYIAVIRYGADEYNVDTENWTNVKSTVSDMKIYKGVDFLTKGESAIIVPDEPEPDDSADPSDPGTQDPTDDGSTAVTPKPSDKDSNKESNKNTGKDTAAATENNAETEETGGCGSVITGSSVALISAFAAGVVVKSRKKKEN